MEFEPLVITQKQRRALRQVPADVRLEGLCSETPEDGSFTLHHYCNHHNWRP